MKNDKIAKREGWEVLTRGQRQSSFNRVTNMGIILPGANERDGKYY